MATSDLAKAAGDRFSIVSALPAALVVLAVFALIQTGAFSGPPDVSRLLPDEQPLGAGTVLLLTLLVFIAALILQPFQLGLIRLLEGYWGSSRTAQALTRWAAAPRQRWLTRLEWVRPHIPTRDRAGRLRQQLVDVQVARTADRRMRRAQLVRLRYPRSPDRVLPTALGNALRSFEDTAGQRYGLETVPAFTRLHPLLSTRLEKSYATQRLQLDTAAGLCVAFAVVTGVSIPALVGDGRWQMVPVATALLAIMAYRGAISSAVLMGSSVAVAFDLHRHDLIRTMHYRLPADAALEYAFNLRLSEWLDNNPDQGPAPQAMPDDYVWDETAAGRSDSAQPDPAKATD